MCLKFVKKNCNVSYYKYNKIINIVYHELNFITNFLIKLK